LITSLVTNIKGSVWQLEVLTSEEFSRRHRDVPGENDALTIGAERRIDFNGRIDLCTVIHELKHAYNTQLCLGSTTNISREDLEEIECEWLEKNLFLFGAKALEVYQEFVGRRQMRKEFRALT
jgi:hypothetical protein